MLTSFLKSRTEGAYALLRIVAGLMFAFHGMQKILGVMSDFQPEVGSQLWFGGLIELFGGLAIAAGLCTTWAAFLSSGTMAVAYAQFHWQMQLGDKFWPAMNKGEMALLYAVLFLFIACRGGGAYSLDQRRAHAGATQGG